VPLAMTVHPLRPRQDRPNPQDVSDLQMIRGTRMVIDLVAGKWNVEVLYLLASGTRRYSQVFCEVGEISKKTLTHTLRALERDGLVARRVYPQVPPKVEYSLTPLGWSITAPLMEMYEWAAENLPAVEEARRRQEREPQGPPALAAAA
jgi:DNA-binding HxlR family transcriptional regulator